jgi:hypothetical protein
MVQSRYKIQLRDNLVRYFNGEELRNLCFELGLNYEDDLSGGTKKTKAVGLIEHMIRREELPTLVKRCNELRPKVDWNYQAKIFIAYKRQSAEDSRLAQYLRKSLAGKGHRVFIDRDISGGEAWLERIDAEIKDADFFIPLFSAASVNSEMVRAELHRAYEYRQQQGYPQTIPVRLHYDGMLPYGIAALVSSQQYISWQGETSNDLFKQQILAIIENKEKEQAAPNFQTSQHYSEDGLSLYEKQKPSPPSPEFDPRLLKRLRAPGGAVRIRSKFYVERDSDRRLQDEIIQWGSTISIRAPRQTGKTSLLIRGLRHAQRSGAKPIFLDLQSVGRSQLVSANAFTRWLALAIAQELQLDSAAIEQAWDDEQGQDQLTRIIEDYVLPQFEVPIILALDEADILLKTDYYQDFFGLIRSWHNRRALYEEWELLNIVLVISTEPYLLIDDINQSPFNVGLRLEIHDFKPPQLRSLNIAHGSPLNDQEIDDAMALINGQPYLTRILLFTLVTEQMSWQDFAATAAKSNGPYSDHLRRLHWNLREHAELGQGLKQIIRTGKCADDLVLHRLLRAGLVKGSGTAYTSRCQLYEAYFTGTL